MELILSKFYATNDYTFSSVWMSRYLRCLSSGDFSKSSPICSSVSLRVSVGLPVCPFVCLLVLLPGYAENEANSRCSQSATPPVT